MKLHPYYSLMGLVAKASNALSRESSHSMPANWLIIVICGALASYGLSESVFLDTRSSRYTRTPEDMLFWFSFACILILIGALFVYSSVRQNIFFRKSKKSEEVHPEATDQPLESSPLLVAGKFYLTEKSSARFLDAPSQLMQCSDGQLVIGSHIDASVTTNATVVRCRIGLWLVVPERGSLTWEEGYMYNGPCGRLALRLKYRDKVSTKKSTAVVTFESVSARLNFIENVKTASHA